MTWTYAPPAGDPVEFPSLKDQIRFLLGDTKQQAWSPSDEDIAGTTLLWNDANPEFPNDPYGIAATIAVAIRDWISLEGMTATTKKVGNSVLTKAFKDNRYAAWGRLVSRLAGSAKAAVPGATMTGFGLAAGAQTPDRLFVLGQFDNGYQRPSAPLPVHLDIQG
jgi:hypothetical protein